MRWVSGEPFWVRQTPIPRQFPYLTEDISTEVVIVGGGITGALTAYYFAKAGVKTVLVDKNIISYNGTSISPAILQYEMDRNITGLTKIHNEKDAVTAFQLCWDAVYELKTLSEKIKSPCGFEEIPCLYFTSHKDQKKYFQTEFHLREKHGFPVHLLDEETAKSKFSLPIQAGILSTGGSAQMDPYQFTHGLLQLAMQYGLTIYEQTEIVEQIPEKDHIVLKTDNHFRLTAQKVIFATGSETQLHLNEKIATFRRSFAIVTRSHFEMEGWFERATVRNVDNLNTYLRSLPDNRILIGGYDKAISTEKDKIAPISSDDALAEKSFHQLFDQLTNWFPAANIVPQDIEYEFSGVFADTKDSLPYIGECEEMPQCYLNLGYGANGILYALVGAKILLERYQGRANPHTHLFRFGR